MVNDDGYRFYLPTQIPTLRLICLLKDLGIELKEIAEIIDSRNISALIDYLVARKAEIGRRIGQLDTQRELIDQRIRYYKSVERWRDVTDTPILKQYDERLVVAESFPHSDVTREVLHPTLMRSMKKLRAVEDGVPVDGFGTMLTEVKSERGDEGQLVYRPAATFTVVPAGVILQSYPTW